MRILDYLGSVSSGVLALLLLKSGGGLLHWLVAAQALLAAVLVLEHGRPRQEAPWTVRLTAWAAVGLPLLLRPGEAWWALGLSAVGLMLSLWAIASLGRAFGVAPADRGLVVRGPYRWVRHPMYTGEALSWLAVVLTAPRASNLLLLGLLLAVLAFRVWWEERIIMGYDAYRGLTPWRFVPGVW